MPDFALGQRKFCINCGILGELAKPHFHSRRRAPIFARQDLARSVPDDRSPPWYWLIRISPRRPAGSPSREVRRPRPGLDRQSRGDRAEPLRQDRVHHQPDPQSPERGPQSEPHAAARRGRQTGGCSGRGWKAPAPSRLPRFRYQENIEAMAAGARSGPSAPTTCARSASTSASCRRTRAGKLLSEISGNPATITLRIVDYPGEWLLDLPLMAQSFAEWSRATLRLYRRGVRAEAARRIPRLHRAAPPRRDRERRDREAGARPLPRLPRQGARRARPELPAAGPLPVSGQSRRRAVPLVRAARHAGRTPRIAPNTLGALMEERYDVLQARGGRALLRGSLPLVLAPDRAGRRAARAARRPRGVRGSAACARSDPAKLPLRLRQPALEADLGTAHRQGAVRGHQGRPRARYLSAITWRNCCATWRRSRRSKRRAASARFDVTATRLRDLDRRGHPGDRRPARAGRGRPADRQRQAGDSSSSARCRSGRRGRIPGTRRSSTCRCSSRRAIDPSPVDGIPHINLDRALEFLVGDRLR